KTFRAVVALKNLLIGQAFDLDITQALIGSLDDGRYCPGPETLLAGNAVSIAGIHDAAAKRQFANVKEPGGTLDIGKRFHVCLFQGLKPLSAAKIIVKTPEQ